MVYCAARENFSNRLTLISVAVTDTVLLLMMLVGLFRLRRDGYATFGLARLLWKQVRWIFSRQLWLFWLIDILSFRKGVIWISIATATEIPPAVSLANFTPRLFSFNSTLCPRCALFRICLVMFFPFRLPMMGVRSTEFRSEC